MTNKEKFILDATSGFRMMWFNKKHPNTIYLDIRPECEPDIIGDYRDLKQFADNSFRLIVFDPNHLIRKNALINFVRDYGTPLNPETWQSDIKQAAAELWRLLAQNGVLIFKWCTYSRKTEEVLRLFPVKPLFGQQTVGRSGEKRTGTFWFCFMKIPKEEET